MDTKRITIEINLSTLEDQTFPDDQEIADKLIDHLYDFVISEACIVDAVHITAINGQSTNDME